MYLDFDYEIEIENHTLYVSVEVEGHLTRDRYGEDADGNRGEWRSEATIRSLKVVDGHGKDITDKLHRKYPRELVMIREQAEEELFETENE